MNEIFDSNFTRSLKAFHCTEVKDILPSGEYKDLMIEVYSTWFKETVDKCKEEVDNFNKSIDFYNKVDYIQNLISNAEPTDKEAWRFFNDTNKTIDSLIITDRKKYLDELVKIDKEYDVIVKGLENELDNLSKDLSSELNKLKPK